MSSSLRAPAGVSRYFHSSLRLVTTGALLLIGGSTAYSDTSTPGSGDGPRPIWLDEVAPEDAAFLTPEMTAEVIEVWAERPEKPFDRDTELRLTSKQLEERGATNLAEALDLLPDLIVRTSGRGGLQINIRGARKGSIKILIDGVPIGDPYYGTFDISSIPVTDIEQIRVSSSPGSPIDGTGGPGGVVEVHTRDAIGSTSLKARFEGSSLPTSNAAATARTMLSENWALRLSATATLGSQDFRVMDPTAGQELSIGEERKAAMGAMRLEYRNGARRAAVDSWVSTRGYTVPPGEDGNTDILVIDKETMTRNSITLDQSAAGWRFLGSGYLQTLRRDSRRYTDLQYSNMRRQEDLRADREGISFVANRPVGDAWQIISSAVIDSEGATVVSRTETTGDDWIDSMQDVASGRAALAEVASGVQMKRKRLQLDAAAGVAIPLGIDASPWPEAKLSAKVSPNELISFKAITGHKGRIPTLRERFEDGIGNEALGPEKVFFGELVVETRPSSWMTTRFSTFNRKSSGQIRYDAMARTLVNLGDLDTRGVEAQVRAFDSGPIGGGALWTFTDAVSELSGSDPLDFLPSNRAEAWLRGRYGTRAGATFRLRFVGEQIDQQVIIDRRTTMDMSAYGRVGEFTGTLRIQNLTGKRFPIRRDLTNPGRVIFFQLLGDWE